MKKRPQVVRKLDDCQIAGIRQLHKSGLTLRAIASRFRVSTATIKRILDYSTYKHVP